jgi:hypothetical protein
VLGEPGQELFEAGFGVGEGGVPGALAGQESCVKLGLADVDAEDVHAVSVSSRPACLPSALL